MTLSSQVTGTKSHKKLKQFSANVVLLNTRLTTGISELICFVFKSLNCVLIQNFMAAIIWRLLTTTSRKFHTKIICNFEQGAQNFPVIFTKYIPKQKKIRNLISVSLGLSSQLASLCSKLAEMVILLFKPKQKLITYIFLPVWRLWFQRLPCKKYSEIFDKNTA